jgi:hypothetical protein
VPLRIHTARQLTEVAVGPARARAARVMAARVARAARTVRVIVTAKA